MKKILVTGGAGFIGSALVRGLILKFPNARISVIDNLSSGKEENLAEIKDRIEFHKIDIREPDKLLPLFKGVDIVFHQAAIPSVPRSIANPLHSHESNINGTFNTLMAAKENGVKRFIYASSSSVYGDTKVLPKQESALTCPLSPYAAQKLTGEHYCSAFSRSFGLECITLRYFNVFGPRQDPSSPYSGVISLFTKSIIERKSPTIFGDGEQARDFTFVDDIVDLSIKAAQTDSFNYPVYNAGTGKRHSINSVWQTLCKIEGVDIKPVYASPRIGDVRDSQADISSARKDFGYHPLVSLEDGLRQTLTWYKNNLKK